MTEIPKFDKQYAFVEKAFEEGAHLIIPPQFSDEMWDRKVNVVALSVLGELKRDEIANIYNISSPGQVSADKVKGIKHFHNNSSEQLQQEFPLDEITGQTSYRHSQEDKEKKSNLKGGVSVMIASELKKGKQINLLEHELPLTTLQITDARRKTLTKWGYDVWETEADREARLTGIFSNPESTGEEIEKAMEEVTISFYKKNNKDGGLFISLGRFLSESGFKREKEYELIPEFLGYGDIPVGKVKNEKHRNRHRMSMNYPSFYLLARHTSLAVDILDEYDWKRK